MPLLPPFGHPEFRDVSINKLHSYYCDVKDFDSEAYKAFNEYLLSVERQFGPQILPHIKRTIDKLAFTRDEGWVKNAPTIKEVQRMFSMRLRNLSLSEGEITIVRRIFPMISPSEATNFAPVQ